MKKALVLAVLACGSTSAAFSAQPDYLKPYDATYEMTSPAFGKSTMHQMSDGKGHVRSEMEVKGNKTTTILDFAGKQAITVMEPQKMYIKSPMRPDQADSVDLTKSKGDRKSLGSKVVLTHPCHGYESKQGETIAQVWIGDDIQNLVLSETTSKAGKTVMALKSYSAKAPTTDLMLIPATYKEMKMR